MNKNKQILYQQSEKSGKKQPQMQANTTSCIKFGGGHLQAATTIENKGKHKL
jgi:hypothetical protein